MFIRCCAGTTYAAATCPTNKRPIPVCQKHLYKVALNRYEASWTAGLGSSLTTVVKSPATTEDQVLLQRSRGDGSEALVPLCLNP